MTRIENLYARLEREDAELLELVVPALRTVVSGWSTGFFTMRKDVPVGSGAPMFEKAQNILALATQLGEPKDGLVAEAVMGSFEHANDITNEQRLGPIRLAERLLHELESRRGTYRK
jgi:hypothetical protein